uniref:beta strand repeat-containing protein n=1 Tax=Roseivirga sp. TaxID=1964215 RepID=UPI0040475DC4
MATCGFKVQAGELDADGIAVGVLSANSGTMKDATGNDAILTLNSVGATTAVLVDAVNPTLLSSAPSDDATNVTLSQNLTLTFDDNMVKGTGNILIKRSADNSTFETIDVTSGAVTITTMQVTINPTGTLLKGTGYYLEIAATALDDDAGNSYAGISGATALNFTTVDVVINEVVTDPQQDWSTNNFNGAAGAGTISDGVDEFVELLIKSAGINLTGWTIELNDGSNIIGDLTNTGAFDATAYSGTGTFNNTAVGDYLVLGNVDGAGAMNNTGLTINLKDPGGAIVDAVVIGGGAGEAPTGDASSAANESVQRFTNGIDTGVDNNDFTKGPVTMGAANTGPSVTLSQSTTTFSEAAGTNTITATLSAASSQTTTVTIGVKAGGTATETNDFTLSTTSIVIAAGNTTGTATLTAVQDALDETDETVTIEITGVTNGTENGTQEVTSSITDDDAAPTVTLSQSTTTFAEAAGTNTVTATLSAVSGQNVTVTVGVKAGGTATITNDFTLSTTSIVIAAGNTTGIATLTAVQDALDETDETVTIEITGVTNGTENGTQEVASSITDDDAAPTVTLSQSTATFAEAAGTNTITATLSAVSGN